MRRIIFALMAGFVMTGCASGVMSGYGQGGMQEDGRSYQAASADNRISAEINRLLVSDPRISAMGIKVSTYQQVVTLSGSVPSTEVRYLAGRLAASVDGVSKVVNRLTVNP